MSDDKWKMPPERDFGFYQRRKHDKWREVPAPTPALEVPVADTHTHVHMLPDPLWELQRAAANNVMLVGCVADPTEDDLEAVLQMGQMGSQMGLSPFTAPRTVFTLGVHPHNAKEYTPEVEARLVEALQHPDAHVLGEIGLDYHYDISPRDVQRDVFRRQLRLAHKLQMPVALHLRSGETEADPTSNAHAEAFQILQEEGFPQAGTLLHCCALPPEQLQPWIDAGCYVAYGGALTFKNGEAAREGACLVPRDRLLLETDSPYMTPEPMRGATCTPAHVIFTAAELARVLGAEPGPQRAELLQQIWENSQRFFGTNIILG